jgi:hypothetical protein
VSLVTQLQRRPLRSHSRSQRWRSPRGRRGRFKTPRWLVLVLLGTVAVSFAALAAWIVAGGDVSGLLPAPVADWLPRLTVTDDATAGSAPVQVQSVPSGAEVRIDGVRRGLTPIVLGVSPGTHELTLRHPDALESVRSIDVPADGTALAISLWRRRPEILPMRPVYPGASLVDARFVADGTVALTVSVPTPQGCGSAASRTRTMATQSSHGQPGSPGAHRSSGRTGSPDRTRSRRTTGGLPCAEFRRGLGEPLARNHYHPVSRDSESAAGSLADHARQ